MGIPSLFPCMRVTLQCGGVAHLESLNVTKTRWALLVWTTWSHIDLTFFIFALLPANM